MTITTCSHAFNPIEIGANTLNPENKTVFRMGTVSSSNLKVNATEPCQFGVLDNQFLDFYFSATSSTRASILGSDTASHTSELLFNGPAANITTIDLSATNKVFDDNNSYPIPCGFADSADTSISYVNIVGDNNLTKLDFLKGVEHITLAFSLTVDNDIDLSATNDLITSKRIMIRNNLNLSKIHAFNSIDAVESILSIEGNNGLTSIDGFYNIKTVDWANILQNPALESIKGFHKLETVTGFSLNISDNPLLTSISGFEELKSVQSIDFSRNASLNTITGFGNLNSLFFAHLYDTNLTSLEFLSNVSSIMVLTLYGMNNLEDVSSLAGIKINNIRSYGYTDTQITQKAPSGSLLCNNISNGNTIIKDPDNNTLSSADGYNLYCE